MGSRGSRATHGRLLPLLCAFWLLVAIAWVAGPAERAGAYTPHAPIQILGNADFTAANGVVGGSGSAGDPYVIEGWEIAPTASPGIDIRNTDRFFVIRDVYVHGAPFGFPGIWLGNLSNGRVEDSLLTSNWGAALGSYVTNVTFARNNASGNLGGLGVYNSRNVTFVSNNASYNPPSAGIGITNSTEVLVVGNLLVGNQLGFIAQYRSEAVVRGNEIRANTGVGVSLFQQFLGGSVAVYHNRIAGNAVQAEDDGGANNRWDNGYPAGGNWWSDYAGADACSGPAQDVCPDPDGIGDTPRVIDADSRDRYPLMAPPDLGDDPPGPPALSSAVLAGPADADVRLDWLPSPDDGAGARDVLAYEVWSGTAYDPAGASYALAATVPAGTTNATLAGQGHGDPADRFYAVRAVDEDARVANASQQAAKIARFLTAGDQLLSVPLEQADWSVPAVLRTLPWTRARAYDAATGEWRSAIAGRPATLSTLNRTQGFWVNVSADAWWTVAGLLPARTDVPLRAGWNLVAYPSVLPRNVSDAFGGAPYDAVEGWSATAPYHLARLAPGDAMAAGRGYWVHATADATVTITN